MLGDQQLKLIQLDMPHAEQSQEGLFIDYF